MKLRFIGQRNKLGVGTYFANFVDAMKAVYGVGRLIEEVDPFNEGQFKRAQESSTAADVNVWFLRDARVQTLQGTQIQWSIFESEKLPAEYLDYLNRHAQYVWVPTAWGRGILSDNGVPAERIDVVPGGIDARLFHPYLRDSLDRTRQPFRFLMVGKFEARKGYRELLAAFRQAFDNDPDVELIIKADYFIDSEQRRRPLLDLAASFGLRNVKFYWGDGPSERLLGLYHYCDAFVFPSRAEGWGLPLLEAAACGLPLIATYYSGHTHFLAHIDSSLAKIDHVLEPITDPDFRRYWPTADGDLGRWASPSVASIAAGMMRVKENYASFRAAARRNSLVLRQNFTWEVAASTALDALRQRNLLEVDYTVVG